HLVCNPVREAVLNLRDRPYPLLEEDGIFRVLVTGGSQGIGAAIVARLAQRGIPVINLDRVPATSPSPARW
ncbi:SDR family NAD(P)-dependent oxidoreductase, partial [Acinetobacter pittii]|uniref:SDR family NAD(P)-dependent oxidoreductase n=1 Tax=Acinetobacter pittii TaxID=48296 RepID=UPI0013D6FA00